MVSSSGSKGFQNSLEHGVKRDLFISLCDCAGAEENRKLLIERSDQSAEFDSVKFRHLVIKQDSDKRAVRSGCITSAESPLIDTRKSARP